MITQIKLESHFLIVEHDEMSPPIIQYVVTPTGALKIIAGDMSWEMERPVALIEDLLDREGFLCRSVTSGELTFMRLEEDAIRLLRDILEKNIIMEKGESIGDGT